MWGKFTAAESMLMYTKVWIQFSRESFGVVINYLSKGKNDVIQKNDKKQTMQSNFMPKMGWAQEKMRS